MPRFAALVTALLLASAAPVLAAPKTDVVLLRDGTRLVGELKSLARGRLTLSTDAASTIYIEWDMVTQLVSNQYLRVETNLGELYFGSLIEPASKGALRVKGERKTIDLTLTDVVRIGTMSPEFSKCWSGDVSAGYSLVSANQQSQFNFDLHVQCRFPTFLTRLSANDIKTGTSTTQSSRTAAALLEAYHLFPERWFAGGLAKVDRNDQLGIDSRFSVGAGGGRYLLQSNSQIWTAALGILETREHDVSSDNPTNSTEGMIELSFDWFRYSTPEVDLSSGITVFPSLTETGRWRGTGNVSLKWEIISNLFLRLQFLGDFDNRSGVDGQSKTDYNVSTSIGYSVNE